MLVDHARNSLCFAGRILFLPALIAVHHVACARTSSTVAVNLHGAAAVNLHVVVVVENISQSALVVLVVEPTIIHLALVEDAFFAAARSRSGLASLLLAIDLLGVAIPAMEHKSLDTLEVEPRAADAAHLLVFLRNQARHLFLVLKIPLFEPFCTAANGELSGALDRDIELRLAKVVNPGPQRPHPALLARPLTDARGARRHRLLPVAEQYPSALPAKERVREHGAAHANFFPPSLFIGAVETSRVQVELLRPLLQMLQLVYLLPMWHDHLDLAQHYVALDGLEHLLQRPRRQHIGT